jgi:hypothetical protein
VKKVVGVLCVSALLQLEQDSKIADCINSILEVKVTVVLKQVCAIFRRSQGKSCFLSNPFRQPGHESFT